MEKPTFKKEKKTMNKRNNAWKIWKQRERTFLGSLLDKIHFHQLNNVRYNSVNINAVTTFPFLVYSQSLKAIIYTRTKESFLH